MNLGKLTFQSLDNDTELVAEPTRAAIASGVLQDALVSKIDPGLSDTAAFCEQYQVGPEVCANCVIVEARRGDKTWYAACMILATTRADVNGIVRKHLDARKISFASMDTAVSLSGMEYGAINPIGLPEDWPILVDTQVANTAKVIIGSGIRGSKLLVPGQLLGTLPGAVVMDITKAE